MPTIMPEGFRVPAGADSYALTDDLRKMMESATTIVPVTNIANRTALVAALVAAERGPTPADPLYVDRADAPAGAKLERTTDGTTWGPPTFTRVSHQPLGAAPVGVDVPTAAVTDVNARVIRKTGVATFTTTTSFGNEYGPVITFSEPFPTSLLGVTMTQIHSGALLAFAGAMATDRASKTDFRAMYVGSGAANPRGFMWEAVGY